MTVKYLERQGSYSIPYIADMNGNESKVLIIVHGFASSKESPTVNMLMKELIKHDMGVIALDLPAHGDSPVDGDFLRLENCIKDLKDIESFARKNCPNAEICYFGSSFGAYIIMQYLMKYQIKGVRVFMRSAAVDMHEVMLDFTADQQEVLKADGYIMLEYDNVPSLKITQDFVDDLESHNLFNEFTVKDVAFKMIHGSEDEDVDYSYAKAFSEKYNIDLITIAGGDHRLSIPGAPEKVLEETINFFK